MNAGIELGLDSYAIATAPGAIRGVFGGAAAKAKAGAATAEATEAAEAGAALGGSNALQGLRDVKGFTPALTQQSSDTCGLYCAGQILDEIAPRSATAIQLGEGSYIPRLLADRGGRGLSTAEIAQLIEHNGGEDVVAIIERGVTETQLPSMFQRGPVIAHVDGIHFVRVLGTVEEGGATWVQVYDPARGSYSQLLSSFMTRVGPNNQMILVPVRPLQP